MSGKGSQRRPSQVSREEYNLRWKLARKEIAFKEFETKLKVLREKENK